MVNTKKALQMLWKDTCTVSEYQEYKKPNGSTGFQEVVVLENQPCKLSFETLQPTNQSASAAQLVQAAKMFIDIDVKIKAGSKIVIQRGGESFEFSNSGLPGKFTNHQEIMLTVFKDWA